MYRRSSSLIILALLTLLMNACAEVVSIGPKGEAVLIDSKKRAIISSELDKEKRKESGVYQRICSEPPPDVFSAFASSIGGDLGFSNSEFSAGFLLKVVEAAGTISRTQTVNLLRESMFRTCERYLNGAIDEPQLIVQAARDQRTMVAILAIEQLTQAARPPVTILGTDIQNTAADLSEAKSDIEKKEKALQKLKRGRVQGHDKGRM